MSPDDRTRIRPASPPDDQTRSLTDAGDTTVGRHAPPPVGAPPDPSATVVNPDLRPATDPQADPPLPAFDQFQPLGEVGRGGMGVVYRALDTHFMRDVAVKILADRLVGNPTATRRFLEEARVTAQLTHTAIPPVHHIGTLSDGRPYLAMKLIQGRTLGERLRDRPDPLADLPLYLGVVEQVCLGVGYAHSRGVIHRDLKPGNVMVGEFGEVQVMDWGLAKEVGKADAPDDAAPELREVRAADEEYTRAGTILGTPAYMPPEQAAGQIDRVDTRADVFSLGAILCVLLTGRPPYSAADTNSVVRMAIEWDTADAFRRLGHCKADPLVVALCKRCLAKDPADRPADGRAVAGELADIRATAAERLRRADLAEMARIARQQELKRRRRWQLGLAGAVAAFLAVCGVAVWQRQQADEAAKTKREEDEKREGEEALAAAVARADAAEQASKERVKEFERSEAERVEREAAIRGALEQVKAALAEVPSTRTDDAWNQVLNRARAAQQRAEGRLKEDPSSPLAPQVRESAALLSKGEADRSLAERLGSTVASILDREQMGGRDAAFANQFQKAFREAGFSELDPDGFAKKAAEHPFSAVLVEAVFFWHDHAADADRKPIAALRGRLAAGQPFLPDWLAAATPGPSGTRAMVRLATAPATGLQPPWVLVRMFRDLWCRGEREAATRVMRGAIARHPASARLRARFALTLGLLDTPAARSEALVHASAALALNPTATLETLVGRLTFEHTGDAATAALHLERAIELDPHSFGGPGAAARIELVPVYRKLNHRFTGNAVMEADSRDSRAEVRLAAVRARWLEGSRTAAAKVLKEKVFLTLPRNATEARLGLVRTYRLMGLLEDAEKECLQLAFDDSRRLDVRLELARINFEQADADPARRAEFHRLAESVLDAAAFDFPRNFEPHAELAVWHARLGNGKKAVAAGERAVKVSDTPDALWALGLAQLSAGSYTAATDTARRLGEKAPKDPRGPELRGQVAAAERNWAEAVRQGESAVRLSDWSADLWDQLGGYHREAGDRAKAVTAFAAAVALDPDTARYQWHLATAYARSWDARWLHHLVNAYALSAKKR
jgi:serine/threonine protein kinase